MVSVFELDCITLSVTLTFTKTRHACLVSVQNTPGQRIIMVRIAEDHQAESCYDSHKWQRIIGVNKCSGFDACTNIILLLVGIHWFLTFLQNPGTEPGSDLRGKSSVYAHLWGFVSVQNTPEQRIIMVRTAEDHHAGFHACKNIILLLVGIHWFLTFLQNPGTKHGSDLRGKSSVYAHLWGSLNPA
jgi:hypothetical protein